MSLDFGTITVSDLKLALQEFADICDEASKAYRDDELTVAANYVEARRDAFLDVIDLLENEQIIQHAASFQRKRRANNSVAAWSTNPILIDANRYYDSRRGMNNPKGWKHVERAVLLGLAAGAYDEHLDKEGVIAREAKEQLRLRAEEDFE